MPLPGGAGSRGAVLRRRRAAVPSPATGL